MNTADTTSSATHWPLIARWKLSEDGGTTRWHLAALNADGSYWGYVHFRTDSKQLNQSFSGKLDDATLQRIEELIAAIIRSSSGTTDPRVLDGLIGVGTRQEFCRYFGIRDGVAEPDDADAVDAYNKILDLLVPEIRAQLENAG